MTRRIFILAVVAIVIAISVAFLPLSETKTDSKIRHQSEQGEVARAEGFGESSPMHEVRKILTAKSFVLADGTVVRLACLQAPNVQEKSGEMRAGEPEGEQSKAALADLLKGQKVTLHPEPPLLDRHDRRVAFATLADGRMVQKEMLKQGHAMVYPFADQREYLAELLAIEKEARTAKRGIWGNAYWQPASTDMPAVEKERFQLVQGIVKQVAQVGGNWYLNFGEDYKTDFTAFVPKQDYSAHFNKMDLKKLEGKKALLRGWVYNRDGVTIDLVLPEQLEVH